MAYGGGSRTDLMGTADSLRIYPKLKTMRKGQDGLLPVPGQKMANEADLDEELVISMENIIRMFANRQVPKLLVMNSVTVEEGMVIVGN
uniref:Translation initiation factor eIF2B gamma chain (Fragments) n=1 Tax=Oryctolagus cuniculus TaxID=9986 RepID=Q7M369_RABIT